jgi:uridylate kinase
MDPTAIAHCMEHSLPILVFNYRVDGNIERAVCGEDIGTRVSNDDHDDPHERSK